MNVVEKRLDEITPYENNPRINDGAEGYVSEWPIVMVPPDYSEQYKKAVKTGEKSWYAPMKEVRA
jgi:hypothetical protein